jgi:membrane-bound serine protease (ClpP class)
MRRLFLAGLFAAALLAAVPALAHEGEDHGPGPVVVVEIEGPMDQRMVDYVESEIRTTDAQVIVLRIDSPGVASGNVGAMFAALDQATVPVAVWVGPQGAVAYGGVVQILGAADYVGAAPGTHLGYTFPTVAGDATSVSFASTPGLTELGESRVEVPATGGLPDFVDVSSPSIGQFIAALDGLLIHGFVLETADQTTLADGSVVTIPAVEVRFVKPGLFTRFLRLAIRPEAAFFFLTAGLALVAFEFYAAGVGVTAAVAALSLFLSAYGLSSLPIRPWAVLSAIIGLLLYTWDFQRNQLAWRSLLGTAALAAGGLYLTDAGPQFGPRWWAVVIVVVGLALFYLFAMTTVVRSRFSTPTIGREYLVGRSGNAETDIDPDGLVSVDGARWRATAHRAAGIKEGDAVTVLGVREIVLEVGPSDPSGRSPR